MSNSPLISEKVLAYSGNYTKGRTSEIKEITVHHMSGKLTARRCGELFQTVGREGSSHYGIGYDGEIALYVDEGDTAWTNSNWESNCRAVTVEVSNSENDYPWAVTDKSLQSLIRLIADIDKRNGLGKLVKGKNLTWHQMYAATDCPGPYLLSKMDYIISAANEINYPTPTVEESPTVHALNGKNIPRNTDFMVLYSGIKTTGTNQWGFEAPIDRNGVVLSDPVYKGDTEIPDGGFVLSGHGKASVWIYANVKKGYRITVTENAVKIDKRQHRSVDGVNRGRGTNHLCVYNSGGAAPTNEYGYEVAIQNGKAVGNPIYGKGKTAIPSGGFVLSGHLFGKGDSAGQWIYANVKNGTPVTFDGKVVRIN